MAKYAVTKHMNLEFVAEVFIEADNADDAIDKAAELFNSYPTPPGKAGWKINLSGKGPGGAEIKKASFISTTSGGEKAKKLKEA